MAKPLVVNLLGPPRFSQAEVPVTCASRKALGLFAYLLLTIRQHSRRELAALLWGRRDDETARASLRVALHRLPPAMAECLRIDRESIELAAEAGPLVDVERFLHLAKADDLASLEEATELYRGELLQDFEADATPEFDDWLHAQRTRLAQIAQQAFDGAIARRADRARLDASKATSERESALATGRRWAALMPGAEAAHRWLMQLYLDMGRRDAALAQFELCQRFLAVTYGRAPTPETRALYEGALGRSGTAGTSETDEAAEAAARRDPVPRSLVPATSFVGRVEELAELDRLLADPHCRLLTLHGLGGAGKTRLAHALATQVSSRFMQGAAWVSLEAIDAADALPVAIATALHRELPGTGNRTEHVASMLAAEQRLLVLDNFESLLARENVSDDADPITVVTRILEAAPQVRILVTSREVLGLQEEWVYDVHGLAHATGAQAAAPAIELFAQRARQTYLGFSLPAEMPHVVRICVLVEGLPLGIELAAAWVRTVPCGEIAAAIEREAAALASPHRNRVERHRTLEAVVGYSWNLLRSEEQRALAGLAAFTGGFTRETAERVAEASTRTLSALVDKSLVRRQADGRYGLHELVRQFAWARLRKARARAAEVMRRHAETYSTLLLQWFAEARGPEEAAGQARLRGDLANLMVAWERSLEAGTRSVVECMAPTLIATLHGQARLPMALRVGEQAIATLGKALRGDVECLIRMQWGRAAIAGQPDVAEHELDAAIALARAGGKLEVIARCLYYRGALAYQQGELEAMDALASEAMSLALKVDDLELLALAHNIIGVAANMRARFDVAIEHLRSGLAAARKLGAPSLIGGLLCGLGVPLYYRGDYAEAAAATAEAARLYEAVGRHAIATMVHGNAAAIMLAQGNLAGAREEVDVAERLARESADRNALTAMLATRADILLAEGRAAEARSTASEALEIATAIGDPLHVTEAEYLLATAELRDGHPERVLPLLLRLRAELREHRIDVRIPMLMLATAEWIVAFGDAAAGQRARRWLSALGRLEGVDATLRDKAKRLLEGEAAKRGGPQIADAAPMTLAEIEADVGAFLDGA